jgi:hypothetical protein
MDKLLLPFNKQRKNLHNNSVMLFLFIPGFRIFIAQGTEKVISGIAFSFTEFAQKLNMIFVRKFQQKNITDFAGFSYRF